MPEGMVWDKIPEPLLIDCAQLVKANSIEGPSLYLWSVYPSDRQLAGNKKDNITIIYTPGDNLKVGARVERWLWPTQLSGKPTRKPGTWQSGRYPSTMTSEYVPPSFSQPDLPAHIVAVGEAG